MLTVVQEMEVLSLAAASLLSKYRKIATFDELLERVFFLGKAAVAVLLYFIGAPYMVSYLTVWAGSFYGRLASDRLILWPFITRYCVLTVSHSPPVMSCLGLQQWHLARLPARVPKNNFVLPLQKHAYAWRVASLFYFRAFHNCASAGWRED